MFGHQDDKKDDHQPINDLLSEPALDGVLNDDSHNDSDAFNPALPPDDNQPQPAGSSFDSPADDTASAPAIPASDPSSLDNDISDDSDDELLAPAPAEEVEAPTTPDPTPATVSINNDDLLKIKQQALEQLSPMVDHLDQSPEEKFHTTMMMIQANDNQDLVKVAYEAAQAITDEKVRAKALLDIVNEINYFTTQHPDV